MPERVIDHREAIRVSWFATSGSFTNARTGRDPDELETFSENEWTAPTVAGDAHLWLVLRDSRGGVAWTDLAVRIVPR